MTGDGVLGGIGFVVVVVVVVVVVGERHVIAD